MLTDRHGRMITANQAAVDILGLKDGISVGREGRLLAWKVEETTGLQDLIATASGYAIRRSKEGERIRWQSTGRWINQAFATIET